MRGRRSQAGAGLESLWTLAGILDFILMVMGIGLYQLETHVLQKTRPTMA